MYRTQIVLARAEQPSAEWAEVERAEAEQPRAGRAEPGQTEPERPRAERPQVEQPRAEQPQAEQPQAEQPQAEQPQAGRAEPGQTEPEWPRAERPQVERPRAEQPQAEQPRAGRAEPGRAEPERPRAERPQVERPRAEQPQAEQPRAERSGICGVVIRAAGPADLAALGDFFAGLSLQSRYLRFFSPITPTQALLGRLSGAAADVDAVIAVRDGVIVGHAMAADRAGTGEPGDPVTADIGVVVADAWQSRGMGAALMRELISRAQARGVTSLTIDVLHANHKVLAMVMDHWPAPGIGRYEDCTSIHVRLPRYARLSDTAMNGAGPWAAAAMELSGT